MYVTKKIRSLGIHLPRMLLTFFMLFTTMIPNVTFASDEVNVPVDLKISPIKGKYSPSEEIQIEAVTKKEGETFDASLEIVFKEKKTIQLETKKIGNNYVSKATFKPENLGITIENVSVLYKIVMKDKDKTWIGSAEKLIRVDEMPIIGPSVDSDFTISPEKTLKVGKKIKFTVHTPYRGKLKEEGYFKFYLFNSVDNTQKVEKVRTYYDQKKNIYITTGYFTPKKEGVYTPFFLLHMYNDETNEVIVGNGVVKFTVTADSKINASISPQTATMKFGDEIYLLLTYKVFGIKSDQFIREYNYGVSEISKEYDEKEGVYKVLIKFKPDKKKMYDFEAKVKNPETNFEAITNAKINVE
ncbi:hypothetical protein EDM56_12570 [Brevibacillus fluminis]|uniref:Uncharacterized protein n=1 Tax=Brevibacillus fluminis TaxID=511487 RepID=A0A3M8DR77_9BACL|nr:hypothetical protein [Brevibacillus fluminis]RNB89979.1 hypothetical protein EDM56_12570 [Brevibacillus fluminis]